MKYKERYLDEIAKFSQGIQVGIEKQYNKKSNGLVRFLRIVDYTQGGDDIRYIDMPSKNHMVSKEDIVMVRYGASAGFIGTGLEGIIANNMFKIEPNEHIDKKFLYYFLTQKRIKDFLLNKTTASAMPAINFGMLSEIAVPIIELETQKKIVEVLDKAQELIDKRKEQIDALDELVKSRFVEMFGDVITNDKKYPVEKLEDITSLITDGTHQTPTYSDSGYIFLSSKNVTSGKINWDDIKYIPEELHIELNRRLEPRFNDILLAKNGTTGVAALVDRDCVFDIYVSLALIRLKSNINPIFMLHMINSSGCKFQFNNSLKGIGVPNLHLSAIRKTKVILPPIELQNEFADFVKQVDKLKSQMQTSLKELEDNFNSLMQKAFKGELF